MGDSHQNAWLVASLLGDERPLVIQAILSVVRLSSGENPAAVGTFILGTEGHRKAFQVSGCVYGDV